MCTTNIEEVRWSGVKAFVAKLITHSIVGFVVGLIYRDQIPIFGIRVDTSGNVSNKVKASLFCNILFFDYINQSGSFCLDLFPPPI